MMNKETYERLKMDVTRFDAEDIITTSVEQMPDYNSGFMEDVANGVPFPG